MLAELLKIFRMDNSLTQREMAKCIGVSKRTYESWEYGKRIPDDFKLNAILKMLEIKSNK